jgi:hypothetical protein
LLANLLGKKWGDKGMGANSGDDAKIYQPNHEAECSISNFVKPPCSKSGSITVRSSSSSSPVPARQNPPASSIRPPKHASHLERSTLLVVGAAASASFPSLNWYGMPWCGDPSGLGLVSFLLRTPSLLGGIFLEWGFVPGDLLSDVSNQIQIFIILHQC